jgi:hypothetical protein
MIKIDTIATLMDLSINVFKLELEELTTSELDEVNQIMNKMKKHVMDEKAKRINNPKINVKKVK